jgi:hypothetical protein
MPKRTRQRGGNCGMDHMSGGRRRKSRRRSRKRRGGDGTYQEGQPCKWKMMGSECAPGLSCKGGQCKSKSSSGISAHTASTAGSFMSGFKMPSISIFGGSKRKKSRRKRQRSRGRKSRRKRRTKKRRRRR